MTQHPHGQGHSYKRIIKSGLQALSPKNHNKPLPPAPLPPQPMAPIAPQHTSHSLTANMKMPDTQTPRATVELSNYPPKLTKNDILRLFAEFQIADFDVPTARSFSVPLRVNIEVAGKGEAQRAVKELSGRVIEGRRVCVKITENTGYEAREVVVEEMANELKLGIISKSWLTLKAMSPVCFHSSYLFCRYSAHLQPRTIIPHPRRPRTHDRNNISRLSSSTGSNYSDRLPGGAV